jgi:hypothetical protein
MDLTGFNGGIRIIQQSNAVHHLLGIYPCATLLLTSVEYLWGHGHSRPVKDNLHVTPCGIGKQSATDS